MLKSILKSWKDNRGNLLLVLGSAAGLLMCLTWYFQLVPEVRLLTSSLPNRLVSTSAPHSVPNSLVGIVRLPPRASFPKTSSTEVMRAVVEVYPPLDTISERILSPLLVQTVTLPDAGGPVAVVFNDLQPGRYAAVAFIDFNDNGRFDIEESGVKSEPFSLARRLGPTRRPTIDDASHSKDVNPTGEAEELPAGIFELVTDQATLIVFDFVSAVPSEWEGVAKPVASPKESQK